MMPFNLFDGQNLKACALELHDCKCSDLLRLDHVIFFDVFTTGLHCINGNNQFITTKVNESGIGEREADWGSRKPTELHSLLNTHYGMKIFYHRQQVHECKEITFTSHQHRTT
jgi:hypothetical protein